MTRKEVILNAENVRLGTLATQIANLLMGKNVPEFEYYKDDGAKVIVTNTDKLSLHPRKLDQKVYYRHTGRAGGIKSITAEKLMAKDSRQIIWNAVYGMLPKNRLRSRMLARLVMYKGDITE